MATNTYVALRTETIAIATNSVTLDLTGISGYTDLRLVVSAKSTNASTTQVKLRFNSDSASNYSHTRLYGDGTSASSDRTSATDYYELTYISGIDTLGGYDLTTSDIMNYANSTTYKTTLTRWQDMNRPASAKYLMAVAATWKKTPEPITTITIFTNSGNFAVGSTFSLYGISNVGDVTPKATGGDVYSDATYWYHAFPMSGRFVPNQSLTCDYLVIAGGGGGGADMAGGGGAGGLRSTVTATGGLGTLESQLSLTATNYDVIVGAGGAAQLTDATSGFSGNASSIIGGAVSITSTGGGFGGYFEGNGGTGGSGGGSGRTQSGGSGGARTASPVQGFNGGGGSGTAGNAASAGGGGGAGAVGVTGSTSSAGAGGIGLALPAFATATATGVSTYYAGGGAGGAYDSARANGGLGGGGIGGKLGIDGNAGGDGIANTGSGGGGGGPSGGNGGAGGSGIVIIRYTKA
jgi:hypothetical protein